MGLLGDTGHMFGCSCKLSQDELSRLLEKAKTGASDPRILADIGEDAAFISLGGDRVLVKSIDFFTPVTDDPHTQGWISVNNACNDLFAKGVLDILGLEVVLAVPKNKVDLAEDILSGMREYAESIGTSIVGGHTITNPWVLTGASVFGIIKKDNIIYNSGAKAGDTLILTKPLGTQPAITAHAELSGNEGLEDLQDVIDKAFEKALDLMKTPAKPVAEVMQKVGVNAATDVTGYGLRGHAMEMAKRSGVDIEITSLPVISGTLKLAELFMFPLREGRSSETAGGILISVSKQKSAKLLKELEKHNVKGYVVGKVVDGKGNVTLSEDLRILEVK